MKKGEVREFESGATRDSDEGKLDYEGFICPFVLEEYAKYLHKHRMQSDGALRDSDNWQRGIPKQEYIKSLIRHTMELWRMARGNGGDDKDVLCAIIFNSSGLLHEILKAERSE